MQITNYDISEKLEEIRNEKTFIGWGLKRVGFDSLRKYYKSSAWSKFRQAFFNWYISSGKKLECQGCQESVDTTILHLHHRTYFHLGYCNNDEMKDIVLLCECCHKGVHQYARKNNIPIKKATHLIIEGMPMKVIKKLPQNNKAIRKSDFLRQKQERTKRLESQIRIVNEPKLTPIDQIERMLNCLPQKPANIHKPKAWDTPEESQARKSFKRQYKKFKVFVEKLYRKGNISKQVHRHYIKQARNLKYKKRMEF